MHVYIWCKDTHTLFEKSLASCNRQISSLVISEQRCKQMSKGLPPASQLDVVPLWIGHELIVLGVACRTRSPSNNIKPKLERGGILVSWFLRRRPRVKIETKLYMSAVSCQFYN